MIFIRFILFPFVLIFGLVLFIRNKLFDFKIIQSSSFDKLIINVGNLTAGGTGKTPHIEYLIKLLLKHNNNPAVLSRGYKRKTTGYILAEENSNASLIGDEPMQMHVNFPNVPVAVCENRVIGVVNLLYDRPDTNIVLLDDAFQHRSIKPKLNILLTTYDNPFYTDYLLPVGLLREYRKGYNRADIIVVTKCPSQISAIEQEKIKQKIKPLAHQKIFFSFFTYNGLINCTTKAAVNPSKNTFVYFFGGIANTSSVQQYLSKNFSNFYIRKLTDHVTYSNTLLNSIVKDFKSVKAKEKILITTQKDWVKLNVEAFKYFTTEVDLNILPVEVDFINRDFFNLYFVNYVNANK